MELAVYAFEPRVLSPSNIVNVLNQSSYLTINGETCVCERDPMTPLVDVLREDLALTGARKVCRVQGQGHEFKSAPATSGTPRVRDWADPACGASPYKRNSCMRFRRRFSGGGGWIDQM